MSALSLRYSQSTQTETEVLPDRWSPLFATFVWSAVSAAVWTAVLGGVALS
jgi:hypothetical protein